MPMTATKLRARLYRVLDRVLDEGKEIIVLRKGRRIRIRADPETADLGRLVARPGAIIGDPDGMIDIDWSETWDEGGPTLR